MGLKIKYITVMEGIIMMINSEFIGRELLSNKDKLNEFFFAKWKGLNKR